MDSARFDKLVRPKRVHVAAAMLLERLAEDPAGIRELTDVETQLLTALGGGELVALYRRMEENLLAAVQHHASELLGSVGRPWTETELGESAPVNDRGGNDDDVLL